MTDHLSALSWSRLTKASPPVAKAAASYLAASCQEQSASGRAKPRTEQTVASLPTTHPTLAPPYLIVPVLRSTASGRTGPGQSGRSPLPTTWHTVPDNSPRLARDDHTEPGRSRPLNTLDHRASSRPTIQCHGMSCLTRPDLSATAPHRTRPYHRPTPDVTRLTVSRQPPDHLAGPGPKQSDPWHPLPHPS